MGYFSQANIDREYKNNTKKEPTKEEMINYICKLDNIQNKIALEQLSKQKIQPIYKKLRKIQEILETDNTQNKKELMTMELTELQNLYKRLLYENKKKYLKLRVPTQRRMYDFDDYEYETEIESSPRL